MRADNMPRPHTPEFGACAYPTVPCKWCGVQTEMIGTQSCNTCWERNRHGDIPYDTLRAQNAELVKALEHCARATVEASQSKGFDPALDSIYRTARAALAKVQKEAQP